MYLNAIPAVLNDVANGVTTTEQSNPIPHGLFREPLFTFYAT